MRGEEWGAGAGALCPYQAAPKEDLVPLGDPVLCLSTGYASLTPLPQNQNYMHGSKPKENLIAIMFSCTIGWPRPGGLPPHYEKGNMKGAPCSQFSERCRTD